MWLYALVLAARSAPVVLDLGEEEPAVGPFRLLDHGCSWEYRHPGEPPAPCLLTPLAPARVWVAFSAPLSDGGFEGWGVAPEAGARFVRAGSEVLVEGDFALNKRYTLTVPASQTDVHGAVLGEKLRLPFEFSSVELHTDWVVTEPSPPRTHSGRTLRFLGDQAEDGVVLDADGELVVWLAAPGHRSVDLVVRDGARQVGRATLKPDRTGWIRIDLAPWVGTERTGSFHVIADACDSRRVACHADVDVRITRLRVVVAPDRRELVAWVTRLADGAPVEGARVEVDGFSTSTGPDGLARVPVSRERGRPEPMVVRLGQDELTMDVGGMGGRLRDHVAITAISDRGAYRPGETVHVKGWVRLEHFGDPPSVHPLGTYFDQVRWRLGSATGTVPLSHAGSFDVAFPFPATTGGSRELKLRLEVVERWGGRYLTLLPAEPEPAELSLATELSPRGDGGRVEVVASDVAGAPVGGLDVTVEVRAYASGVRPPGAPWPFDFQVGWADEVRERVQATTDAEGRAIVDVRLQGASSAVEMAVVASAVDRRGHPVVGSTTGTVGVPEVLVGLRVPNKAEPGEAFPVEVLAVDTNGDPVPGARVEVWARPATARGAVEAVTCEPTLDDRGRGRCTFVGASSLTVEARVLGDPGATSRARAWVNVLGGRPPQPARVALAGPTSGVADGVAHLELGGRRPANGLWTVSHHGGQGLGTFRLEGPDDQVDVPLTAALAPAAELALFLVGPSTYVVDRVSLVVDDPTRRLEVGVEPRAVGAGEATLEVAIHRPGGEPVAGAEVVVSVVDDRAPPASDDDPLLGVLDDEPPSDPGPLVLALPGDPPPLPYLPDVPTVLFTTVVVGADGTASIPVRLPDLRARYRVTVLAADDDHAFGIATTTLRAP
ncbi:MAG: hypothetical protein H6735_33705 [Alphaproteobacteria bacterium]|nr:hypothetical protein [Alphaproteobacteria bacterium]